MHALRSYVSATLFCGAATARSGGTESLENAWRFQSASAQQTSLHHFRYKIDIRDWPWHISQRDRDIAFVAGYANFRAWLQWQATRWHSTFAGSISSLIPSDATPLSSRRRRRRATTTTMTSLRNANWKAEGTVHVRDYLPRSTAATTDISAIRSDQKILIHRNYCSILFTAMFHIEQAETNSSGVSVFVETPIVESLWFSLRNTMRFHDARATNRIRTSCFLSPSILIALFRNPTRGRSRICDTWETRQSCTLNIAVFFRGSHNSR